MPPIILPEVLDDLELDDSTPVSIGDTEDEVPGSLENVSLARGTAAIKAPNAATWLDGLNWDDGGPSHEFP